MSTQPESALPFFLVLFLILRQPLARTVYLARRMPRCPAPTGRRFGHSCRADTLSEDRRRTTEDGRGGKVSHLSAVVRRLLSENGTAKKGAAVAGGSKVKQGGVKQSGQEPLDV